MGIYIYNKEQIKRIENACLIAASVLDEIETIIGAGVSTHEIDTLARSAIRKSGASPAFLGYKGFPAAVCTSINEVVVHGIPSRDTRLKSGDIIGIDIGVYYKDYYGDTARSYAIGSVGEDIESLLNVTRESLYRGIEKAVAGNRVSDVSHAVEAHVTRFGFAPVEEFVGHGIGKNLHEEPSIPNFGDAGKGPRIREGMVFAIEPMINAGGRDVEVLGDGWTVITRDRRFSAHFEHTVAIVDGKAQILTSGKNFN
ncbi:MAG TPA: type I methionyl aminopeptidase [Spirochaetota bacterium]|nr:type I methionyl aminopeptidase [Spirochaetota bacterium]